MELENGFRPFGVINDAEFRGTTWLGVESVPKLGLEVDHFYYSRTDDSREWYRAIILYSVLLND